MSGPVGEAFVEILPQISEADFVKAVEAASSAAIKAGAAQFKELGPLAQKNTNFTGVAESLTTTLEEAGVLAGEMAGDALTVSVAETAQFADLAAELDAVMTEAAALAGSEAGAILGDTVAATASFDDLFVSLDSVMADAASTAGADAGAALDDAVSSNATFSDVGPAFDDAIGEVSTEASVVAGEAGAALENGIEAGAVAGAAKAKGAMLGLAKVIPGLALFAGAFEAFHQLKEGIGDVTSEQKLAEQSSEIFGKNLEKLEKQAGSTSDEISKLQFNTAIVGIGRVLKTSGHLAGKALEDTTSNLVNRAQDLASKTGKPFEDALGALQKSIVTGSGRALRPFGVAIGATDVQMEALKDGIISVVKNTDDMTAANERAKLAQHAYSQAVKDHGKNSDEAARAQATLLSAEKAAAKVAAGTIPKLTTEQKIRAAANLVLRKTAFAQGSVTKHSGDLADQEKRLGANLEDFRDNVVKDVVPALEKLTSGFIKLIGFIRPFTPLIEALIAAFLAYKAVMLITSLAQKAAAVATIIYQQAMLILSGELKLATVAQYLFNTAVEANPIGLMVAAAAALAIGFIVLYKKSEKFRHAIHVLGQAVQIVFEWVKKHWPLLAAILTGPFGLIILLVVKFRKQIIGAISTVVDFIRQHWKLLLAILTGPFGLAVLFISKHIDKIVHFVSRLPGRIKSATVGMWDGIKDAFREAINWVIEAWNGLEFKVPGVSVFGKHIGGFTIGTPDIPTLGQGAIVDKAVLALLGEAGREVVIPLTKPQRALELSTQSGLLDVLARQARRQSMTALTPSATITPTTTEATTHPPVTVNVYPPAGADPAAIAEMVANRLAAIAGVSR